MAEAFPASAGERGRRQSGYFAAQVGFQEGRVDDAVEVHLRRYTLQIGARRYSAEDQRGMGIRTEQNAGRVRGVASLNGLLG
jgi:hypothetical protein